MRRHDSDREQVDIRGVSFDDFVVPKCEDCKAEGRVETIVRVIMRQYFLRDPHCIRTTSLSPT
jgi:hypothetical protein